MRTVGRAIIFAAPAVYKGCDAPAWPASSPGGRLGPHTAPPLVAAAWERRARALWSPALGQPVVAAPVAAAAPPPVPAEPTPPPAVPAAAPGQAPGLPGTFA